MSKKSMMRTFSKVLRQSSGDHDTLFHMQIHASVSSSSCIQFDALYVENPIGSKGVNSYVGLYRNTEDSFLVIYKDQLGQYPKDIVWLKDCLVTSNKYVSNNTLSILCGQKTILFRFDQTQSREAWQKYIRDEILYVATRRAHSNSISSSDGSCEEDIVEKLTCLRRSRSRESRDLKTVFIQKEL